MGEFAVSDLEHDPGLGNDGPIVETQGREKLVIGKRSIANNCRGSIVLRTVWSQEAISGPQNFADLLHGDELFSDFVGGPCESEHEHHVGNWHARLGAGGNTGGVRGSFNEEPGTGVVLLDDGLKMWRKASCA